MSCEGTIPRERMKVVECNFDGVSIVIGGKIEGKL